MLAGRTGAVGGRGGAHPPWPNRLTARADAAAPVAALYCASRTVPNCGTAEYGRRAVAERDVAGGARCVGSGRWERAEADPPAETAKSEGREPCMQRGESSCGVGWCAGGET
eukprot:6483358-Prymnesium_polylepis.1